MSTENKSQALSALYFTLSLICVGAFTKVFFNYELQKATNKAVYHSATPKVIEKRIESNNSNIELYRQQIIQDSIFKIVFNQRLNALQNSLTIAKSVKDTLLIIRNQDTIIQIQERIIYTLENTSEMKDSVIGSLYNTIRNQDTLININKQETNRIKKQRNWSLGINALLTTLLIIK